MTPPNDRPLHVGVWLPAHPAARWRGEGIAQTIEFILLGMTRAGVLPRLLRFTFFVTETLEAELRASLEESLGEAMAWIDIVRIADRRARYLRLAGTILTLGLRIPRRRKDRRRPTVRDLPERPNPRWLRRYYRREMGAELAENTAREYARRRGGEASAEEPATACYEPGEVAQMALNLAKRTPGLRRVAHWVETSLEATASDPVDLARLAAGARDRHAIDVWWIPQPNTEGPEFLKGPKVANFWDFVIGEYAFLWEYPVFKAIYSRVRLTLLSANRIVTQSVHNRDAKLIESFDVVPEAVEIVYLSGPDHYRRSVSRFAASGRKTEESLCEAADIVAGYLQRAQPPSFKSRTETIFRHGLGRERARVRRFDRMMYAMISTQNRPYKNLAFILDAFLTAAARSWPDACVVMTTDINMADSDDRVAQVVHKHRAYDRIFVLPRVPNRVHAALYHCATVTLHPSLSEGGVGAYPFLEGMTMGTPGLVARAEYSLEGLRLHPDYEKILFRPSDKDDAVAKIARVLADPQAAFAEQESIYRAHMAWRWEDVGRAYTAIFAEAGGAPDVTLPREFFSAKRSFHSLKERASAAAPSSVGATR